MSEDHEERARAILAAALEVDRAAVSETTAIGTEDRWDSLAHLRVIEAVEAAIGRPLEPEAIVTIASFTDVADVLRSA